MPQPSTKFSIGAGMSSAAPFCAPAFTHATKVRISSGDSDRSFAKCPYWGSAYQGGIIFFVTTILIMEAHGRVCSYVSIEKGAASPGRWQLWQCFCKIGATSFVNVGGGLPGSCPSAYPAQQSAASSTDRYFMNFLTSRFGLRQTRMGQNGEIVDRLCSIPFIIGRVAHPLGFGLSKGDFNFYRAGGIDFVSSADR